MQTKLRLNKNQQNKNKKTKTKTKNKEKLKTNQVIEESTPSTATLHKLTTKHYLSNTLYPNPCTHHLSIVLEPSSQPPTHTLPVRCCSHPLDSFISPAAIDDIQHAFNRDILFFPMIICFLPTEC